MVATGVQIKSTEEFDFDAMLNRALDHQEGLCGDISDHEVEVGENEAIGPPPTKLVGPINLKRRRGEEEPQSEEELSRKQKKNVKKHQKRNEKREEMRKLNGGLKSIAVRRRQESTANSVVIGASVESDLKPSGSGWRGPAPQRSKKDDLLPLLPTPPVLEDLKKRGFTYVDYDGK